MRPFLINGAKIKLKPDPGWSWEGWDGVQEVRAVSNPMKIDGQDIIHENDVPFFTLIPFRAYKAVGFSDTPGTIITALFSVNKPTLSDKIKVSNAFPLLKTTTGKFTCNYTVPSFKATPGGPVPDPVPLKTGTWSVVDANQQVAFRVSGYEMERQRIVRWLELPANKTLWEERKRFAREFYRSKGWTDDVKINSHIKGIDFTKPIEVIEIPPPNEIYQYQRWVKNENGEMVLKGGKYYTLDKNATPSELGISPTCEVMDNNNRSTGEIKERVQVTINLTGRPPVQAISSTAKPLHDRWSFESTGEEVETTGGANQLFINEL